MGGVKKWFWDSRALVSMLAVQLFATGLQLLSRIILSEGTFVFALMAYRNVVGAVSVAPFALLWERGKAKEMRWSVLFWLFMNALTGVQMAMGLFYYGLKDTTATYAVNFLNLIPVATFVFSTIIGVEKLGLHRRAGKVKTLGAILCLGGALIISLYKGKTFHIGHHGVHQHLITRTTKPNWTRGTLFLVASVLSYATWFIVQVKLFKVFPYKYWATLFTCIIASIQSVVIGLCLDRKEAAWKLGWNLQLITIFYSGVLATALTFCLLSWAIANRGPTYPSMFNPLSLIFVAIIETLFMGQDITVGSLLGMLLIVVGLYLFLWAKSNELKSKPPPKAVDGEAAIPDSESAGTQFTAIVMPTASPITDTATIADKNENEAREI
ncbi:WAT1-related protein At5g64700-like [Cornus florida]|uniref:WAT1-related protein At5g64700-like n=1 Tax=Cornus florida TaxID=4283 RepID=UPI00289B60FE|nr:WAT1-related protein At5g64700-like [Cornus florida]